MHIVLTTATLAVVTLAIVLLRFFWFRLPAQLQKNIIYADIALVLLRVIVVMSKWNTTSDRFNVLLNWAAIAGYELLVILFTLYPPKWITITSAVILILPLFGSTILLPLGDVFDTAEPDIHAIDSHYFFERSPWDTDTGNQNTGVDLLVYYRPPFAPFLRRRVQRAAFNNDKCDSAASFVTMQADRKSIRFHCPPSPSQQNATAIDLILPIK